MQPSVQQPISKAKNVMARTRCSNCHDV